MFPAPVLEALNPLDFTIRHYEKDEYSRHELLSCRGGLTFTDPMTLPWAMAGEEFVLGQLAHFCNCDQDVADHWPLFMKEAKHLGFLMNGDSSDLSDFLEKVIFGQVVVRPIRQPTVRPLPLASAVRKFWCWPLRRAFRSRSTWTQTSLPSSPLR